MVKTDDGPAIEVRDLVRAYRGRGGELIKANDGVSFTVPRGQVFGLFGANGAGKTTLVLQLLGLVKPTSGSATVNGIDVNRYPAAVKSTVGFLPQHGLSMRMIETRRALHYTGRLRGQSERDAQRQADELLDELGLGPYADRHVERLSGGLMRLVNFGMTLMGRPELLVLDEPTNELDPHNRRLIWEMIERRAAADGTTIVLVTHNVLEAEKAVHRVAVMHDGRITAMGTPGELKEQTGAQARLELFVRNGGTLTEGEKAQLGRVGAVSSGSRSGSYLVTAEPDRIQSLIEVLVADIGVRHIDDFRFARPTLEDVYLNLRPDQAPPADASSADPAQPTPGPATGAGPATGTDDGPASTPGAGTETSPDARPRPETPPHAGSDAGGGRGAATPLSVPLPAAVPVGEASPPAPSQGGGDGAPQPLAAAARTATATAARTATAGTAVAEPDRVPPPAPPAPGAAPAGRGRSLRPGRGSRSGADREPGRTTLRKRLTVFATTFKYLWFEHMLIVRSSWYVHVVFGIFMPLTMVFGFSRIGSGLTDEKSLTYIASGAGVFAIAALGTTAIAQRIGAIKAEGSMMYYASLPISKIAFVMAFIGARMLLIAPGLLTSLIAVQVLYDIQLTLSPMLLLIYPLIALPLAALGMIIGSLIDRIELISIVTYMLNFVLLLGAPLLIPLESLPLGLRVISYLMPTTYGADAIRRSVGDDMDGMFGIDILVLVVMSVVALAVTDRALRWRAK